ncbi:unnamed protein product [Rhodiola kirilowii]
MGTRERDRDLESDDSCSKSSTPSDSPVSTHLLRRKRP